MEKTKENELLNNVSNSYLMQEYDYIVLINKKTKQIIEVITSIKNFKNEIIDNDYNSMLDNLLTFEFHPDNIENLKDKIALNNIVDKLDRNSIVSYEFSIEGTIYDMHVKKLQYSYYENDRNIIIMSCEDVSQTAMSYAVERFKLTSALNEVKHANDAKTEFLSRMSHDMRTPLNGIMCLTDLAIEENNIETIKGYLSEVSVSSKFLLGLINDVLDMSKIENKKVELHEESYDLSEFSNYLEAVIKPLCDAKHQKFEVNIEDSIPKSIMCDKLRINQIFFNVLSNSSKYTNEDGRICLNVRKYGENRNGKAFLQFEIEDNGVGMSKQYLERIYEPFSREERGNCAKTQGTGLGLSIVQSLVELMHGSIKIMSKVDIGTKVLIHLIFTVCPSKDELEEAKKNNIIVEDKELNPSVLAGKRILLVEDTEINALIVIKLLEKYNVIVEHASDGKQAFDMFMENEFNHFDAILMDIRMPVMDGIECTKEIRKLTRSDAQTVPIIAVTANAFEEDIRDCLEIGMDAHVSKPIVPKELYETIIYMLKKKKRA